MDRLNQIKQYFEGKLTLKEAYEFLNWFTSSEHEDEVQAELDKLWHTNNNPEYSWDGSKVFEIIQKKRENGRSLSLLKNKPEERTINRIGWRRIAAAIVFLMAVSLTLLWQNSLSGSEQVEVAYQQITKSNPAGQKSRVFLPDGSAVNLNSDSKLSYTQNFAEGRKVYLEGEAFFDVKKDSLKPFTVFSGRLSTTALGTSFNISAYGLEEEVVLVNGKVNVKDRDTQVELILDPGEKVKVGEDDHSFGKSKADIIARTYWKEGILYFNKTRMQEIIATLERWYGVHIKVDGEIPEDKCTGLFQKNEYLTNVLDVLSHSVAFEYSLDDKEVKLKFN